MTAEDVGASFERLLEDAEVFDHFAKNQLEHLAMPRVGDDSLSGASNNR